MFVSRSQHFTIWHELGLHHVTASSPCPRRRRTCTDVGPRPPVHGSSRYVPSTTASAPLMPSPRSSVSYARIDIMLAGHLDDSVSCSRREPLICWVDSDSSDPAHVARDDPRKFPFSSATDNEHKAASSHCGWYTGLTSLASFFRISACDNLDPDCPPSAAKPC